MTWEYVYSVIIYLCFLIPVFWYSYTQGFISGGTRRSSVPEPIWRNNIPKKQK
jgi:hypothetical protein